MIRLEMRNYNMTSTEKDHTILALSSGKIDKYDYLKGEEILPTFWSKKSDRKI